MAFVCQLSASFSPLPVDGCKSCWVSSTLLLYRFVNSSTLFKVRPISPRDLTAGFGVILFTKICNSIIIVCFNEEEEEVRGDAGCGIEKRRESCCLCDFDFVWEMKTRTQDTVEMRQRWRDRRKSSAPDFTPSSFGYLIFFFFNFFKSIERRRKERKRFGAWPWRRIE